ncbi:serine/threonine protein kinase [Rippkaea orientalis PCC 8801]|uniref:Serine/threonine protein kinase n=1 Tax=Rippkaea orientalis (strain PCC 8801 / RF-1) TaxID=41431 RepID=B7K5S1_RIPO1|nr:bifunctional serine/threonine-protein kinase/formylglycine-generating enzyme family protein [Rippkaea orientalis]ACK67974.1 serine/threonine protein kinase [Rippkaea orientalis PCC 8801]
MLYCLNPSCPNPENPDTHQICHGCSEDLNKTTKQYLFHQYRVIKLLGEGGFGRTYLAQDTHLMDERRVIKKLITPLQASAFKQAQELFKREAQRLYEFSHPQIPKLYAYFSDNNSLYLVQEFIDGHNLFKEVLQQGQFKQGKILQLLQELLPVLDYIHSHKVLHRDIKPENIMRRRSTVPNLILIDFGAAKQIKSTLQPGNVSIIYTPGYGAMEQMMGQPCSASDIYSLGVTCIRLLTGSFPHHDQDGNWKDDLCIYDGKGINWQWKEYAYKKEIPINKRLANILDRMIEPSLNERYSSANQVLEDLENLRNQTAKLLEVRRDQSVQKIPSPLESFPVNTNNFPYNQGIVLQLFEFKVITLTLENSIVNYHDNLGQAEYYTLNLTSDITLDMVLIPGGKFLMGSPLTEPGSLNNERPQHWVTVSSFYMGKYPITQAQWQEIMGDNPAGFQGMKRPVERVNWYDCVEFCHKLSQRTNLEFKLPSEAQWEYACRAQTTTPFYFGETITSDLVNYDSDSTSYMTINKTNYLVSYSNPSLLGEFPHQTTDVGSFPPNAFGLYDMHGNVWEWCADNRHKTYQNAPIDGSIWETNGQEQYAALRGGSWNNTPELCRSAYRHFLFKKLAGVIYDGVGLRVVSLVNE